MGRAWEGEDRKGVVVGNIIFNYSLQVSGIRVAAHYAFSDNMLLVFVTRLSLKLSSVGSMMLFPEICVVTTERSVVFTKLINKTFPFVTHKQKQIACY